MISRDFARKSLRLGLALAAGLALSACARNSQETGAGMGGAGFGAGGAGTPGSPQDFAVNVGDRVFFDSDSSELNAQAVATLDKQAQWLTRYSQYAFTVEGHADERGTREYNFALGARRSEAVKNYLSARGVSGSRIRVISYGKERPVEVCDDIRCWSKNRRAVTVLGGGPAS